MAMLLDLTPLLFFVGAFTLGVIIGASATWLYFEKKYFLRPINWRAIGVTIIVSGASAVILFVWFMILSSPEAPGEQCSEDVVYWTCGTAKTPR
jgi:ABC-type Fe3+ transport system permease subunit